MDWGDFIAIISTPGISIDDVTICYPNSCKFVASLEGYGHPLNYRHHLCTTPVELQWHIGLADNGQGHEFKTYIVSYSFFAEWWSYRMKSVANRPFIFKYDQVSNVRCIYVYLCLCTDSYMLDDHD